MCGYCGCEQTHHHHDHRIIEIEQDILTENNRFAAQNREYLNEHNVLAFNLVSSPGSGKTTLLIAMIHVLSENFPISVIEGDQQTDRDAKRIAATGVKALQINTGKVCHLDAHHISHALLKLTPKNNGMLFIENVGNLVCPALFDLGETAKVVILSVTEGDDKPLKYPHMFDQSQLMIINKIDLLPYVSFDVNQCIQYARQINPAISVLQMSAITGEGISQWCEWLMRKKIIPEKNEAH